MDALRVEGLSKSFGGLWALNGITFRVEVGERLAIIGPNGAGKTTLFNLINGQLKATRGYVYLNENEISNLSTHRRAHLGLSRSFQISSLFLPLTVLENCMLALQGMKTSRYQMFRPLVAYKDMLLKAQELLDQVALWDKRNHLVKYMSYGDQRRLEIAMSLASDPRVLMLDEPSAGLTAAESAKVVEIIHGLRTDMSVLMVAHDMDLVYGVATRIIVLHSGEILADGTPEEIKANPMVNEIYMGVEGTR